MVDFELVATAAPLTAPVPDHVLKVFLIEIIPADRHFCVIPSRFNGGSYYGPVRSIELQAMARCSEILP